MARSTTSPARAARRGRDEWSCRVCTLLNNWRERRCGACDSERPADADSQPTEWTCGVCTLVNEWTAQRCVACEQERPESTTSEPDTSTFARGLSSTNSQNAPPSDAPSTRASPRSSRKRRLPSTPTQANSTPMTAQERPQSRTELPPRPLALPMERETSFCADTVVEADTIAEDGPEVPSFNLLSFVTGPVTPTEPTRQGTGGVDDVTIDEPTFSVLDGSTVDLTTNHYVNDAATLPKLHDRDSQLVKAGLHLSDSESDEETEGKRSSKRLFRRRRSLLSSQTERSTGSPEQSHVAEEQNWECSVCTNLNSSHSSHCDLCNVKRDQSARDIKPSDPVKDLIACAVCTHLNPTHARTCEVCNSQIAPTRSEPTFTCVVCTNINPGHLDQCELCETKRKAVSCRVCTSLNDVTRKRCEVCETILVAPSTADTANAVRHDFDDPHHSRANIYSERTARNGSETFDSDCPIDRESVGDFEDGFDDRFGEYPLSPRQDISVREKQRQYPPLRDDVEDISDHEMHGNFPSDNHPPAQSKRPELREFQHFLTVDDARLDYQCQIDYRSMFADSSRSRSYADRLQKRRRESQKRKRKATESGSDPQTTSSGRGASAGQAKATKAGRKKAKGDKRASTGRVTTKGAKKARASTKPRRSSAPAMSSGVNHYDTIGEDIGDEVTTMAWEGVGSAGYF